MDIDMADMGMGQYPVLSWAVGPPPSVRAGFVSKPRRAALPNEPNVCWRKLTLSRQPCRKNTGFVTNFVVRGGAPTLLHSSRFWPAAIFLLTHPNVGRRRRPATIPTWVLVCVIQGFRIEGLVVQGCGSRVHGLTNGKSLETCLLHGYAATQAQLRSSAELQKASNTRVATGP